MWHDVNSVLRTHKYQALPYKISRLHDLVSRICASLGIRVFKEKVMATVAGVCVFSKADATEQVGVMVML